MAEDRIDGRPYLDTVSVPGVLVMAGDPWPAAFYSRFPEAFRLPVRITWRDGSADEWAVPEVRSRPALAAEHFGGAGSVRRDEPPEGDSASAVPAAVPPAGPGGGGTESVGAFLRVNDFLDRLMGKAGPGADGSRTAASPSAQDPNTPVPSSTIKVIR